MAKWTFVSRFSWSDHPDGGENRTGQLPDAVVLPDGERVGLDLDDVQAARWDQDKLNPRWYVQLHVNVRVREGGWGEDPARSVGRSESRLEVQAPRGSRFLFARMCPWCGEKAGEQELPGEHWWEQAEPLYHARCRERADEEERLIAEAREEMRREAAAEAAWLERVVREQERELAEREIPLD